jgi:hypothetical protein
MVDPSYFWDSRLFRNGSQHGAEPLNSVADGSPGEIRTPVGRSLLPLGDPEPTRDAIDIWPNVRAMLDHYTTGLQRSTRSSSTNKRFRAARTEVTYILVENLIYVGTFTLSLSSSRA